MNERHGLPAFGYLKNTARHEAGHLLVLWLLERYAIACGITDGCGVTKALDVPGEKETPHQRILYAMSGMVLAGEFELLSDLRRHATEPDYFDPMSDSHYVVEALLHIDGGPAVVLSQFSEVILRLGNRFRKAHNQAARLLDERGVIAFDTIHGLFCQWDVDYDLVARPKSDLVCRAVAHTFHWRMPRGRLIGWDFKPLPEGFVAPEQLGLVELAERVMGLTAANGCQMKSAISIRVQDPTKTRLMKG